MSVKIYLEQRKILAIYLTEVSYLILSYLKWDREKQKWDDADAFILEIQLQYLFPFTMIHGVTACI